MPMCHLNSHDDESMPMCHLNSHDDVSMPCSEQKIAQFRTDYLTKKLAYVSTQQSGQFDTFLSNHFSFNYNLA
jgi:hypothetical protein